MRTRQCTIPEVPFMGRQLSQARRWPDGHTPLISEEPVSLLAETAVFKAAQTALHERGEDWSLRASTRPSTSSRDSSSLTAASVITLVVLRVVAARA